MTSLTQRSSGLVQRRTEASRSAADKERAAGGGGGSGEDDAQSRRDEQDDDDKGDSKETRLTLMEEVLLLGLKDREVRAGRGGRRVRASALRAPAPGAPGWPGAPRSSPHRWLGFSLPPSTSLGCVRRPGCAFPPRPAPPRAVRRPLARGHAGCSPTWRRGLERSTWSRRPRTPGLCGFQHLGGLRGLPPGRFKSFKVDCLGFYFFFKCR